MAQSKFLKGYRHQIFELRPQPERILYAAYDGDHFVLLTNCTKKRNDTDPREIEKALNRLDDWLKRK